MSPASTLASPSGLQGNGLLPAEKGLFSSNNPSVPAQRFARGKDSPEKTAQPKKGSSNALAGLTQYYRSPQTEASLILKVLKHLTSVRPKYCSKTWPFMQNQDNLRRHSNSTGFAKSSSPLFYSAQNKFPGIAFLPELVNNL